MLGSVARPTRPACTRWRSAVPAGLVGSGEQGRRGREVEGQRAGEAAAPGPPTPPDSTLPPPGSTRAMHPSYPMTKRSTGEGGEAAGGALLPISPSRNWPTATPTGPPPAATVRVRRYAAIMVLGLCWRAGGVCLRSSASLKKKRGRGACTLVLLLQRYRGVAFLFIFLCHVDLWELCTRIFPLNSQPSSPPRPAADQPSAGHPAFLPPPTRPHRPPAPSPSSPLPRHRRRRQPPPPPPPRQ